MSFDDPAKWIGAVIDVLQWVALVAIWLRKPGEDAGHQVTELKRRVDVHEERLRHVSTTSEMGDLDGDVKSLRATLEAMQASFTRLQNSVDRLEAFLRENR